MNNATYFLPADGGGGSYFPGLVLPAAVLLIALLSAATVIYLTRVRGSKSDRDNS